MKAQVITFSSIGDVVRARLAVPVKRRPVIREYMSRKMFLRFYGLRVRGLINAGRFRTLKQHINIRIET